jgi:hypothetical protein
MCSPGYKLILGAFPSNCGNALLIRKAELLPALR